MRIAWFTPFHHRSAIGRVGLAVAEELSRNAEVDIWHPAASDILKTQLKTIPCPAGAASDPRDLARYDLLVYNMGNHLPNHLEIYETARNVPGVVILHDLVMHHFFAEYYLALRKTPAIYAARMERHYGDEGLSLATEALAGIAPGVWETDRVIDFPFFEDAILGALGVITHSEFSRRRVKEVFSGPVQTLFLPSLPEVSTPLIDRESLELAPGQSLVITVGHANPNKRILEVVEILGSRPEAFSRVVYAVVGQIDGGYREKVLSAANRLGIASRLRLFDGFVPDELLQAYVRHADVCLNLRFPVMESASASLVEAMLAERAIIVNDSGFYQELPSDCVRKISPGRESVELGLVLQELLQDDDARRRLGASARQHVVEKFRLDRYAAGIMKMAEAVGARKPLLQLMDRTADRLHSLGLGSEEEFRGRLAGEARHLFGAELEEAERPMPVHNHVHSSDRTIAQLRQASAAIGAMPPCPRTLRGRFGAILVSLVRRAMFWFLPQLEHMHALLISFCAQQEADVSQLRRSLEDLRIGTHSSAESAPLEQQLAEYVERMASNDLLYKTRLEGLEARLDALGEAYAELWAAQVDEVSNLPLTQEHDPKSRS